MQRIWTSRFSNKELNSGAYYCVGITLGKPKFKLGYEENEHCYMLAPRKNMWGKSPEEFEKLYTDMLDKYGERKVMNCIMSIVGHAEGKDVVLLCYEDVRDPDQNCHRTVLADWLNAHGFGDIEELPDPSPVKYKQKREEPDDQLQMFAR